MKRRQFLSSTVAAATLAAMPGLVAGKPQNAGGEILRLGFIGTGRQGRKHVRLAAGMPGIDIRAICDILPFQLDEAKKLVGPETSAVDDYRQLLDDPRIDAVSIATPFHFHAQPMLDALDAGKHVYCEKTLVKGHDQIEQVRKAIAQTDRVVQAGYQHRYSDHLQYIAGLIESGEIGDITRVECQWNRNGDWRRPVPSPEYERAVNWRMYREYSGGLVAELSSHQMDIIQWMMNSPPKKIMGAGGMDHWKDGRDIYDSTHLTVQHENEVVVTYTCLTTNSYEGFRMKFLGTSGTIVTTLNEAWITSENIWKKDMAEGIDAETGATMSLAGAKGRRIKLASFDPSRNAIAAFRESVLTGNQPASNATTGLASARTVQLSLDAMDKSSVEIY
jgi:predicted dehydrogenase